MGPEPLLIGAVIAVGVLHTLVPDHWMPIAIVARSSHWTRGQTARAAAIAGLGHTVSTLAIGVVVWFAGLAFAQRFGNLVSIVSGLALVAFGVWIAVASLREMRTGSDHHHADGDIGHSHDPHDPQSRRRTALLLIVGSSPMLEGIPAFFAAAKFGVQFLLLMAVCFAVSTIATYIALCVFSHVALERLSLGPLERYGEVFSGAIVAVVGVLFLLWPVA